MTLPDSIILPLRTDMEDPVDMDRYMRDYTWELTKMYDSIVHAVNGSISTSDGTISPQSWIPTLKGTTTAGTFIYAYQTGLALRQGLMVDIWFDIEWTALDGVDTPVGDIYLELPYTLNTTSNNPYSTPIQSSDITYPVGTVLSILGISNTLRGELWTSGSAVTSANLPVIATGEISGHFRYLGQNDG